MVCLVTHTAFLVTQSVPDTALEASKPHHHSHKGIRLEREAEGQVLGPSWKCPEEPEEVLWEHRAGPSGGPWGEWESFQRGCQ